MSSLTNNQMLEAIGNMTVLELCSLTKALQEKFGVTAGDLVQQNQQPVQEQEKSAEEQTEFAITLESYDQTKKIQVIKVIRTLSNLSLVDAKNLVESAPKEIKTGISKTEAETIKKQFEGAGAVASIK